MEHSLPEQHLSDRDLIMAADGELPARRKAEVSAHLDACWSCRERRQTLENSIGDFVRARRTDLNPHIPDAHGPRALLRARLAEAAQQSSTAPFWSRPLWHSAPAAAVFICVVAATAMFVQKTVNAEGPKPRTGLTPGETLPITLGEVCSRPDAEVVTADIPEETRKRVFSEYGIRNDARNFEVDYLITPDLGGSPSIRNLWPQPYSARWNARVKDRLEQRLHQLVCEGKLDLPTAQREIANDWIGAYKKYFHTDKPLAGPR